MNRIVALAVGLAVWLYSMAVMGQEPGGLPQSAAPQRQAEKSRAQNTENYETAKAEALKNYQARIQILQQTASCIQSASDFPQIKACHQMERDALKAKRDQLRAEMEATRAQRKQARPAK
jgi:hypothetical protein